MKEDYLHYLWKFQLIDQLNLISTEGERIVVLYPGVHNQNSGPDFLEAKIHVGNILWFGHVEIHVNTSDWNKHRHQFDNAYNNVILHVVLNHDVAIINQRGHVIPTLELKTKVNTYQYDYYLSFLNSKHTIPCARQMNQVPSVKVFNWMERLVLIRMENRSYEIAQHLEEARGDWNEVTKSLLFRYFGMGVNNETMGELSRRVPYMLLRREMDKEALLFGQAGFLDQSYDDVYFNDLKQRYLYLKRKRELQPINKVMWNFSRLRPLNFPTIRLAQLAEIFCKKREIFSLVKSMTPLKGWESFFQVEINSYWETHYQFGKDSHYRKKELGSMMKRNLFVNVVVPLSFAYGKSINDNRYMEYGMELLGQIPPEQNAIIRMYEGVGVFAENASQSQALLELYKNYCQQKKCLYCSIGVHLLREMPIAC